jgi:acyl dehydratase
MRPHEPYFYEDLEPGQVFETPRRTVTETDLVTFAMFTSDWNPVHTDAVTAREAGFARPLVHGAMGLALATGLIQRTGMFEGSAVALLNFQDWNFRSPLFVGDTVHTRLAIEAMRLSSRGDRGIVTRRIELLNQDDQIVCDGLSDFMVLSRATTSRIRSKQ